MKRLLLFAAVLLFTTAAQAGTVEIVTVPATSTVGLGSGFDVVIQVQAGAQEVDGAAAYINFDQTILQVASISAGSTLPFVLANAFNNSVGTINYAGLTFSSFPTGTFTLATVHFTAIALSGGTPLTFSATNPRKTDATRAGVSVFDQATPGSVIVLAATSTPTSGSTPTRTPTGPTPTRTVTPTFIPTPPCVGDCNNDGQVTLAEYALCTSIFSGNVPLSQCPACDQNGDGQVQVNEVQKAQLNNQNGCAAPAPGPFPYDVNWQGSDAIIFGQAAVRNGQSRAPLNLTLLPGPPSAPATGDFWCESGTKRCCFRVNSTNYCMTAQ